MSKITRCSDASDTFNQKYRLVSLCNSYSDVKLKAGCKVGGIEAARLAIGLETGTGEADLFQQSSLTKLTCTERTSERSNPMLERAGVNQWRMLS